MRKLVAAVCSIMVWFAMPAIAGADRVSPPGERGPYNVGTTLFTATMSGGRVARVQAFYPTRAPADPDAGYTLVGPGGSFRVSSIHGVAVDAVAEPGEFPLLTWSHGGTGPGGDIQRVSQLAVHELLATHGFVTVLALHSGDRAVRARDLRLLVDLALARSATPGDLLHGSMDAARVGLGGFSAGGDTVINVAAGWDGLPADPRVRALLLYEPGFQPPVADVRAIAVPYLLLRGDQLERFTGGIMAQSTWDALFASTTLATPRIQVRVPDAVHFNFLTGLCAIVHEAREAALRAAPSLPEPLTTLVASNFAAATAYGQWNIGQSVFPSNGAGFGGGRNVCHRVGVDSVRTLDADGDGATDAPPFRPLDPPYTPVEPPRHEVTTPLIAHYTVAFAKVFLAGDHRYMRYLTPGHARAHGLPGAVTIAD